MHERFTTELGWFTFILCIFLQRFIMVHSIEFIVYTDRATKNCCLGLSLQQTKDDAHRPTTLILRFLG